MSFKKYDGSAWQSINPKKLKGVPYTGTLPATLTGTKAGYLHKYKVYGNLSQSGTPAPSDPIVPSECGERTENWFDADSTHQGYYNNSGNFVANNKYICSQPIIVNEQNYTISAVNSYTGGGYIFQLVYFDANDEYISLDSANLYGAGKKSLMGSVPSSATKMIAVVTSDSSERMLVAGSTAPTSYIPYGYKLPLTSGNTPVDIYIGDDTISAEEYVDSGTGKIYRMVSGTLTPTDPPVPFPQIPTSAGSTTISWAGSSLAPSQFDSIQEWVDIPTYTYTSGAWVADN